MEDEVKNRDKEMQRNNEENEREWEMTESENVIINCYQVGEKDVKKFE